MKVNDGLVGLVLFAIAVSLWMSAGQIPNPSQQPYGPGFFPRLLGALLAIPSVLLVVAGWRARGAGPLVSLAPWTHNAVALLRFFSVPIAVAGYVLFVEDVGFLPIATLVLLFLFSVSSVPLLRAAPLSLGMALVAHTVFYLGLGVQLPWGILAPIAW